MKLFAHITNSPDGNLFVGTLRAAKVGRVVLRGRNKNRKQFYGPRRCSLIDGTILKDRYQQDLPLSLATHYAVYLPPRSFRVAEALLKFYAAQGKNVLHSKS